MNILFIDIDTLRPDHMGCYGYKRNTTPNMDAIAREGVVFNNYYCSDAPCLPSRASLVSGMLGIRHGAVGHGGTAADMRIIGGERGFRDDNNSHNLWNIFRKAGMYTASISTFPERHSSYWFSAGFHEMHNVGKGGMESGELVLPVALDWLERCGRRYGAGGSGVSTGSAVSTGSSVSTRNAAGSGGGWFLHLHLWDPHTPYRAPAEFGNPFENVPLGNWIDDAALRLHLAHVGPHSINEINMYNSDESDEYPRHPGSAKDMVGVKRLFDGYDCGVRYADELIGKVFDKLKALGIYDETAVIITSDHGENMGELGIYAEHATADHATCHIPMIIKWPGAKAGSVDDGLHYNIDLAPTIAELLGVAANKNWDGVSYAGAVESCGSGGNKYDANGGREFLVLSQMAHVCQRSVRFGDWLYMRTYDDGLHLFDKEMLFNIKDDPFEQHNVASANADICCKGAKYLLDWFDNMMTLSDSAVDPMRTVLKEGGPFHARGHLDSYCARLEATGRGEGAARLKARREAGWLFGVASTP
ncbi:MAG: sulfatase [Oscillospiraceae bacterium]|nr:sulfatase [Oscillospiraceae bacterium]